MGRFSLSSLVSAFRKSLGSRRTASRRVHRAARAAVEAIESRVMLSATTLPPITLTPTGAIYGAVLNDANDNLNTFATPPANTPTLQGQQVYLDLNNNGTLDANEPVSITNPKGFFHFRGLKAGAYTIGLVVPSGYAQTLPAGFNPKNPASPAEETVGVALDQSTLAPPLAIFRLSAVDLIATSPLQSGANSFPFTRTASAIQPDGKLLIAGYSGDPTQGTAIPVIVRYNPDGTLDRTFGTNGLFVDARNLSAIISDIALDPSNGSIVAAGDFAVNYIYQGYSQPFVDRISAAGVLVNQNVPTINVNDSFQYNSVRIVPGPVGNRILVAGLATAVNFTAQAPQAGTGYSFVVAFHDDPIPAPSASPPPLTADTSYGASSGFNLVTNPNLTGTTAFVAPDNSLYVPGQLSPSGADPTFALIHYTNTGSTTQTAAFAGYSASGTSAAILPAGGKTGGDVVVGGYVTRDGSGQQSFALAAFKPGGGLDPNFGNKGEVIYTDLPVNTKAFAPLPGPVGLVVDPASGDVLLSGLSTNQVSITHPFVAAFNPDGSQDTTFGNNVPDAGSSFPGRAIPGTLQRDGTVFPQSTLTHLQQQVMTDPFTGNLFTFIQSSEAYPGSAGSATTGTATGGASVTGHLIVFYPPAQVVTPPRSANQPPTAAIDRAPSTDPKSGVLTFRVHYAAAGAPFNVDTFGSSNIQITTPGGGILPALYAGAVDGSGKALSRTAVRNAFVTYFVLPPAGGFNGKYSITLQSGQVFNTSPSRRSVPRTDLGSFGVTGVAPVLPDAFLVSTPKTIASHLTSATFTVEFRTGANDIDFNALGAVGTDSFGSPPVTVTASNGKTLKVSYVSLRQLGGNDVQVTYSVTGAAGNFNHGDNGTYTVSVLANRIVDSNGIFVPGKKLAPTFQVAVP